MFEFLFILSSGSLRILAITCELKIILQNTSRRVVVSAQINISRSNIFQTIILLERYHQNCIWLLLVNASINALVAPGLVRYKNTPAICRQLITC